MKHKSQYFALGVLALGALFTVLQLTGRPPGRGIGPTAAPGRGSADVIAAEPAHPGSDPGPAPTETSPSERKALSAVDMAAADDVPEADGFDATGIYGTVMDANARPIPGAKTLLFPGTTSITGQEVAQAAGTCDEKGRYRFGGLNLCEAYFIYTEAEGYQPALRYMTSGHDSQVTLRQAQAIRGRVLLAETREPVALARISFEQFHWLPSVLARAGGSPDPLQGRFLKVRESLSNEEGYYELAGLRFDRQQKIRARRDAKSAPQTNEFQLDPGQTDGYDILLDERTTIELVLYDLKSGDPLAIEVDIHGASFTADSEGRIEYSYPGADHARYLRLKAPGYCQTISFHPKSNTTKQLRIPMTRGAVVRGRVVDAKGRAVEGAFVNAGSGSRNNKIPGIEGASLRNEDRRSYSDAEGRYEVFGIVPGAQGLYVRASHRDHARSAKAELNLPNAGDTAEIELVLGDPGSIQGILSIDGEPGSAEIRWSSDNGSGRARSNDRGFYRLRAVPPGEVTLKIRLDGASRRENKDPGEIVAVRLGEVLEHDIDFHTDRVPLSGYVVDERGTPMGGVNVYASADLDEQRHTGRDTTKADGSFYMLVSSGPGLFYRLSAHQNYRTAKKDNISPGADGIELVLPDVGLLRLKAIDAFTRESIGARLYYRRHAEEALTMLYQGGSRFKPGPDGSFLARFPIGTFEVVVTNGDENYVPARIERVRITYEDVTEASTSLDRGVPTGVTFKGDPEVVALFQKEFKQNRIHAISLEQEAERKRGGPYHKREVWGYQRLFRKGDSRGEFRALAPGTYRLLGLPKKVLLRPTTFEIQPRDQEEITIRLERRKKKGNRKGAQR